MIWIKNVRIHRPFFFFFSYWIPYPVIISTMEQRMYMAMKRAQFQELSDYGENSWNWSSPHLKLLREGRRFHRSYRYSKVELQSRCCLFCFRRMPSRRRTQQSCTSSQKSELLFFLSWVEHVFPLWSSGELEEEKALTSL